MVCVNWNGAKKYVAWLKEQTGQPYRLPSEAEWEYAARAGADWARYWGNDPDVDQACRYANVLDLSAAEKLNWIKSPDYIFICRDSYVYTAPAGRFTANEFKLKDMLGNAWEWTEDCWNDSYEGSPSDGSAWRLGDCDRGVLRGGSWRDAPWLVRSANRRQYNRGVEGNSTGFRLARTL